MFSTVSFAGERSRYFIHANGYGPVKIGMTEAQASRALGKIVAPGDPKDENFFSCHDAFIKGETNVPSFMVEEGGIITRVDVYDGPTCTDKGIRIGSTEKEVYKKYGKKVKSRPHFYLRDSGKYLIVPTSKNHEILFETDRGKVINFRVGKLPSVEYVEGCE